MDAFMALAVVSVLLGGVAGAFLIPGVMFRNREWLNSGCGWMAAELAYNAVVTLLYGNYGQAAAFAVLALLFARLWRRGRRKRKRSLRAFGAKSRTRIAAMVRNMPKPGPALRPVPQAAS